MKLIGNEHVRSQIQIAITSARKRNKNIPHMLFSGAAGCGKTSTAKEVASNCGTDFIPIIPESLKDYNSVIDVLNRLNFDNYDRKGNIVGLIKPTILFMDEVHNLPLKGQEILGIAMENFMLEAKTPGKFVWTPYFTIVGATTNDGLLSKPFRDRFKLRFVFEHYDIEDSIDIVRVHADRLGLIMTDEAIEGIAKRGRGTPRLIVGYIERVMDMAYAMGSKVITKPLVDLTFKKLRINVDGFTHTEMKLLKALYSSDTPIGLDNLSIIINEAPKTITSSIEPYLLQKGMLIRSGKGRLISTFGKEYLDKIEYEGKEQVRMEIDANYIRTDKSMSVVN